LSYQYPVKEGRKEKRGDLERNERWRQDVSLALSQKTRYSVLTLFV
jgi:hypothetical protein